jgi:L,D-peptidoglycan transpeptidase YkuD (ErfK/YbiS/YcfS/YnhG family)
MISETVLLIHPSGQASWRGKRYPCALGVGGVSTVKREGDSATPIGSFPLRRVFYRPDRLDPPETSLPVMPLTPGLGWCDDPGSTDYNRLITLPHPARHETLWREDGLYDLIVEIGYNDDPVVAGRGSAIFMHIAKPDYAGTEGCAAFARADLLEILTGLSLDARIEITAD